MSGTELSREQLLEYVKKQRLKIKKLETDLEQAKSAQCSTAPEPAPAPLSTNNSREEELLSSVQALETRIADKEGQLESCTQQLQQVNRNYEQLQLQFNSYRQEAEGKLGKLQRNHDLLTEELGQLEEQKLQQEEKLASYEQTIQELTARASNQTDVEDLRSKWSACEAELKTEMSRLRATLEAESCSHEQERSRWLAERQQLSHASTEWSEQVALLTKRLETQAGELEAKTGEIKALQESLALLQSAQPAVDGEDTTHTTAPAASGDVDASSDAVRREESAAEIPPATTGASGAGKGGHKKKKNKGKNGSGSSAVGTSDTTQLSSASTATAPPSTATATDTEAVLLPPPAAPSDEDLVQGKQELQAMADTLSALQAQLEAQRVCIADSERLYKTVQHLLLHPSDLLAQRLASRGVSLMEGENGQARDGPSPLPQEGKEAGCVEDTPPWDCQRLEEELLLRHRQYEAEMVLLVDSEREGERRLAALQAELTHSQQQAIQAREAERDAWERDQQALLAATREDEQRQAREKDLAQHLAWEEQKSELQLQLQQTQEEMRTQQSAREDAQRRVAQLEDELAARASLLQQREEMNKKLTLKLKQKMKECEDLVQQVQSTTHAHASVLASTTSSAEQLVQLQAQLQTATATCQQREAALATLTAEHARLGEEAARTARDWEARCHTATQRVSELEAQVKDLDTQHQSAQKHCQQLTDALRDRQSVDDLVLSQQRELRSRAEEIERLTARCRQVEQDGGTREEEAQAAQARLKALLAKVTQSAQEKGRRVQALETQFVRRPARFVVLWVWDLQRETWAFLSELVQQSRGEGEGGEGGGGEGDGLAVLGRCLAGSPPTSSSSSPTLCYYFVYTGGDTSPSAGSAGATDCFRWIDQATYAEWSSASLPSPAASPTPPVPLLSLVQRHIHLLTASYTRQAEAAAASYQALAETFSTYKARAQSALRRLNQDEREAQQQASQLDSLSAQVAALETQLAQQRVHTEQLGTQLGALQEAKDRERQQLQERIQAAHDQVEALRQQVDDAQATATHEHAHVLRLREEAEHATADMAAREKVWRQQVEDLQQQLRQQQYNQVAYLQSLGAAGTASSTPSPAGPVAASLPSTTSDDRSVSPGPPPPASQPDPDSGPSGPAGPAGESSNALVRPAASSSGTAPSTTATPTGRSLKRPASLRMLTTDLHTRGDASSVGTQLLEQVSTTSSGLLIHQQTDHFLKEHVKVLREENSSLLSELSDLRNGLSLRDEQIASLKSTLRELEASLLREREFQDHADGPRIQVDYLVNVLRKFLLTLDPSERMKLVSVVCSLLHLNLEETREILEVWTVKPVGGLVGWLLPKQATNAQTAVPRVIGKAKDSGMGGGGDMTYDPHTGGGLDWHNPY